MSVAGADVYFETRRRRISGKDKPTVAVVWEDSLTMIKLGSLFIILFKYKRS